MYLEVLFGTAVNQDVQLPHLLRVSLLLRVLQQKPQLSEKLAELHLAQPNSRLDEILARRVKREGWTLLQCV